MFRPWPQLTARLRRLDRHLESRIRARGTNAIRGNDEGFVLLESIVVIGLISVVMAAFTTFFVGAITSTNHERARQAAAQVADSGIETIRGLPVDDLTAGHNTVSAIASTQFVNNVSYAVSDDLVATTVTGIKYLRATVTVGWSDSTCPTSTNPALCTYSTSTLLNQSPEPCLFFFQTAPLAPKLVTDLSGQRWTVGDTRSVQLVASPTTGSAGYTWSWSAGIGSLPPGMGLSPSGLISGSPTAAGSFSALVTISDACLKATQQIPVTVNVVAAPTIVTPPNQTSTVNVAIVPLPMAYTCPNTPCTFAIANPPIGLAIDKGTGVVSGTPTIPGTVTVTVTVTDADGFSATTNPFTWTVLSPATVCVKSIALPNGSFEAPVRTPGADTNWLHGNGVTPGLLWNTTEPDNNIEYWHNGGNVQDANGGLPIAAEDGDQWAELNANGVGALYQDLTTVPGQVLQWSVYHRARGVNGSTNDSTDHDVMQVQIGSPTSQSPQVPTGQSTPDISDGPLAWVRYTGVYTVPAGQTTTRFQFAAISTSSGDQTVGNFIDNLSLNNNIACLTNPVTDQTSTVNTPITPFSISVDRGTGPFTWGSASSLPAGLVLSSSGIVTGTPTAVGTTPVILTFSDATAFTQSVSFNWTVFPKPTITAPANQTSQDGVAITVPLTASCLDVSCTYVLNNGPPGLTVSSTGISGAVTGTITGLPQVYKGVTVTVTDQAHAVATTTAFTWTVVDNIPPSGGFVDYPDGITTLSSVTVTFDPGTDSATGINTGAGQLQRASTTLSGGTCATPSKFTALATGGPTSTYTDNTIVNGNCYAYRYVAVDNAGTQTTYTSPHVVTAFAQAQGSVVNPVWTVSSSTTGSGATYGYSFTTATKAILTSITMSVPAGTTGAPAASLTGFTQAGTVTLSGTLLTYSFAPITVSAGTAVAITVSGLANTANVGTFTSAISTFAATVGVNLPVDVGTTGPISLTNSTLVNPVWTVSSSKTSATGATYGYSFTTASSANPLTSVTMTVPAGTAGTPAVTVTGLSAGTIALAGNVLTYTLTTPSILPSNTAVTLAVTGLTNTAVVGTYVSEVVTNVTVGSNPASVPQDSAVTTPIPFTAVSLVSPEWMVTNSATGGSSVGYTYLFKTATAKALSSMTVTLPPGTSGNPTVSVSLSGVTLAGTSATLSGGVLTYSFTSISVPAATAVTITLNGLTNTSAAGVYTGVIGTYTTATAGVNAPVDSGFSNPIAFTAGIVANPSLALSSTTPGAASTYTYSFSTTSAANPLTSVTMTVPFGTAGGPAVTVVGLPARGSISLVGNTLTYTLATPATVAAGSAVTVKVTGLTNTPTAGTYTGEVVTNVGTAPIVPTDSGIVSNNFS